MIVNDRHCTVFIHIPKCAGTTVRKKLEPFDDAKARFFPVKVHPELGQINYGHIPLFILRKYFPEEYTKVKNYKAYALIRSPMKRFASSFSQHHSQYGVSIAQLKPGDVRKQLDTVIALLQKYSGEESYLPFKYIHFQRQTDFISDQGLQLVQYVYDISEVSTLLTDIGKQLGVNFSYRKDKKSEELNASVVFRNRLAGGLYELSKKTIKPLLPDQVLQRYKGFFRRLYYVPTYKKLNETFESREVADFVAEFYKKDVEFYQGTNKPRPLT